MGGGSKKKKTQPEEYQFFLDLRDFVESTAQAEIRKGRIFSPCVRASFAKCYEFNVHAWDEKNADSAFFWLATLRGICEDLIVLSYIKGIPYDEREILVSGLVNYELENRLAVQDSFFRKARPQQSVLGPLMSATQRQALEERIRQIWRAHGWPNIKRNVIPPTRQIAEKRGGDILATLYDYLYRLTSSTVHFNVQALLRTGWGDFPRCTFSPTHFSQYYALCGRIYGAYMFCTYFELFAHILRTDEDTKRRVADIRRSILSTPRWPEMVTFEELNIQPPEIGALQVLASIVQSETEKRLLKK